MKGSLKSAMIGIFVLIALGLAILSVILFGGSRLFEQTTSFVLFFDGTVHGLSEGAPVTFRGVKVGTVSDIRVRMGEDSQVHIPVYIRLETKAIVPRQGPLERPQVGAYMEELVADGLRAELRLNSLITAQLMVQLDFYPDEPPLMVGGDLSLPELPTRQSGLQKLSRSVEQLPLDQIAERLSRAVEGIDRIINSPETRNAISDLALSLLETRQLLTEMRPGMGPLREELRESIASVRRLADTVQGRTGPLVDKLEDTADESRRLAGNLNRSIEDLTPKISEAATAATTLMTTAERSADLEEGPAAELLANLTRATANAEVALEKLNSTLEKVDATASAGSPLQVELGDTLGELRQAARSLRVLADYIQRHPEALFRGKGGEDR